MEGILCGKDYLNKFDPFVYLQRYANVHEIRSTNMLTCYHNAFNELTDDLSVLDYGSGPTIIATISAATKASEIVLSDYSPTNCEAIRNWLDKSEDAFNWDDHFQFVITKLEGKEEEVLKRKQKVRKVVKAVVHCDLTQDPPIEEGFNKLYDVVISSFVLQTIAKSYEDYKSLLYRFSRLVKPNGCLMLFSVENNGYYTIGDQSFRDFPVSSKMAVDTVTECGSSDLNSFEWKCEEVKFMFIRATRLAI